MEARRQQRAANAQVRGEEQASMNQKKAPAMIAKGNASRIATAKGGSLNLNHVCSGCNISRPARFRD